MTNAFQQFDPRWLSREPVNAGRDAYHLVGFPAEEFLVPPIHVFAGASQKVGLRLSRAEVTLATARHLERLLLPSDATSLDAASAARALLPR